MAGTMRVTGIGRAGSEYGLGLERALPERRRERVPVWRVWAIWSSQIYAMNRSPADLTVSSNAYAGIEG
jgi:hypothetical protein